MNKYKQAILRTLVALLLVLSVSLTACAPKTTEGTKVTTPAVVKKTTAPATAQKTTTPAAVQKTTTTKKAAEKTTLAAEQPAGKMEFVDSVGRKVEVPTNVTKVAPSGPLAQIVMFTAFPERLVGLARGFSESQIKLFGDSYNDLPAFGQFYGGKGDFNKEAVIAAGTELMIDIGEAKKTMKEDMDKMMEDMDIPTVFVEAKLANLGETYRQLGKLFGDAERVEPLAQYAEETIKLAEAASKAVPEDKRLRVYWATGEDGLNTNTPKSFHAEVLNLLPLVNVADVEPNSKGGGTTVSMEQILEWNPDVILVDGNKLLAAMKEDEAWTNLAAFQNEKVYVIPSQPYNFLARPPSVNRLMGVHWLGSLFCPEQFTKPINETVKEFYKLFYHVEVDDATVESILDGTFK